MRIFVALAVMTACLVLTACEPSETQAGTDPTPVETTPVVVVEAPAAPTPAATIADMLTLAEAGDWGAYVDTYYGEAHKFRGQQDRDALVARFEQKWGATVLEGLRKAAGLMPEIDEQGRAVFSIEGAPVFMLYPADGGRWTFHL